LRWWSGGLFPANSLIRFVSWETRIECNRARITRFAAHLARAEKEFPEKIPVNQLERL